MSDILPKELSELIKQYQNASNKFELQIREKLEKIADCYSECSSDEHAFTDVITVLFCRTLTLMRDQLQRQEEISKIPWDSELTNFTIYKRDSCCNESPFQNGDELRIAFYNHFRNEQKKKSIEEKIEYPAIHEPGELKGTNVNTTIRDYAARIKTFANGYIQELPRVMEIWDFEFEKGPVDPVLFVFNHIELILANFDTKELGENNQMITNKQKNNIRSALRKLNEFKKTVI